MTKNLAKHAQHNCKTVVNEETGELKSRRTVSYERFDEKSALAYFADEMTEAEWVQCGTEKFGVDKTTWKFKCPKCGKTSTVKDFINAGSSIDDSRVCCIGNFTGTGCCWKSNSFFGTLGKGATVVMPDSTKVQVFPFGD